MLPPIQTASDWSLEAAIARPSTPVVAFRAGVRPSAYDRQRLIDAVRAPKPEHERTRPPRPSSIPTDVDEDDMLPRLSYEAKGKWPAGRPPTPKSIDLPEISLNGHTLSSSSSRSSYSDESQRSIFFAP